MEIIQPDNFWQVFQEMDTSPESKLILAIMKRAWIDANTCIACYKREKARRWFFSDQFELFCDLLNIDSSIIQIKISQRWKPKLQEKKYEAKMLTDISADGKSDK